MEVRMRRAALGHGTHVSGVVSGIVAGQAVNESNLPHIGVATAAYIFYCISWIPPAKP